jgi:iron complex outermembrane recepter protein
MSIRSQLLAGSSLSDLVPATPRRENLLHRPFVQSCKTKAHGRIRGGRTWTLAVILAATMLLPMTGRGQEPSPAPTPTTPQSGADPGEPPAAPASPGAKPAQGQLPVPEVVVTEAKPRPKPRPTRIVATRSAPRPLAVPQAATSAIARSAPNVLQQPAGQPVTTISAERIKDAPAFSVADLLQESPGISIKQGNGPRDLGISIRGSNARNTFGARNIVMLDDGFPVTQPDGLSRTDLIDPHAYGAVDVYRGPSSAMFGNYATGGAINFRLRKGGEINGVDYGFEGGSFGYVNNYLMLGGRGENVEASLFASDVRGDGYLSHSSFNTQTVNGIVTFSPTPDDRITVKGINNLLFGNLSVRLSLNQFFTNPYQRGCLIAATAAPGCATVNLFVNGFSAPTIAQTADQAGLHRDDRRSIIGARWEHDFDNQTTWRTQVLFDDRNINQPTGATSAIGDFPSYNVISDITRRGQFLGFELTHFAGAYYNSMVSSSDTVNVAPGGNATLGRIASNQDGLQYNAGGRAREELKVNEYWTAVAAFSVEKTVINAVNTLYTYPAGVTTRSFIPAEREFLNTAPEAALIFRPNKEWQFRGRVATGYGTPNLGQLFVTPAGVPGNNTQLQTQKNLGYDVGFDWTPLRTLRVSVTGFYEIFHNEQVTQSPGAGLQNFTFNAPRSIHQGVEVAADWRPLPGWRFIGAYTFLDQFYTNYTEQLSAGALTRRFDRAGNKIPGISPNELTARLGYDEPAGPWQGVGGFVELVSKDAFFMENANLLKAPGYQLVNLNLHYNKDIGHDYVKRMTLFFEVKNVFEKAYVASANNITDSISPITGLENPGSVLATTGTGSIYAGAPRTFIAGLKLALR